MNHEKEHFKDLKPTGVTKVRIGHDSYILEKGMGTITIETQLGTKAVSDIFYVPYLDQKLFSVRSIFRKRFQIVFRR